MSKKSFISLSIVAVLIALIGVLFGAVFCLRTQNVVVLGESPVDISRDEIITAAGLKNGKSIFMLDKETAINNIEKKYSYIKVVQIKTTNLTEIEIRIRARHEMFYTEFNNSYYILDEELKVLNVFEKNLEEPTNEPTNLIHIKNGVLNISSSTLKCDFVGSEHQRQITYELFKAVVSNIKLVEDDNVEYYTRADMCDIITYLEFEQFNSYDKIVLSTRYGVKLDIENPTENAVNKMNICLSTIKLFIEQGESKEQSGTIKIYYDLNGNQQCVYISAKETGNE